MAAVIALTVASVSCADAALTREGDERRIAPSKAGTAEISVAADLRSASSRPSRECRYAWDYALRAASDLAYEARLLAACAERGDFRNACKDTFWRVRNAQTDYQSAVNAARAACTS